MDTNKVNDIADTLRKEIGGWSDEKLAAYRRVVLCEQEDRLDVYKKNKRNKFFAMLKYLSIIEPRALDHIDITYGYDETTFRYTSADVDVVIDKLVIDDDGDVDTDGIMDEFNTHGSYDYDYVDEERPYLQVNFDRTTPEWVMAMFKEFCVHRNYMEVYL